MNTLVNDASTQFDILHEISTMTDDELDARVAALEVRLKHLWKTNEDEFERVVRSLQVSEPRAMCRLAYGKQTRMLEFLEENPGWA